jgi:transcriptional regulator with PAS, ATPase and Fis domain
VDEIASVWGTSTIKVNIRLIAATNEQLRNAVSHGGFREDLFYRLNVAQLTSSLRECKEDVRDQHSERKAGEAFSASDISPTGDQFLSLRELEDNYIEQVLAATGSNKTQAPRILGIHPTSLQRRLKGMALD